MVATVNSYDVRLESAIDDARKVYGGARQNSLALWKRAVEVLPGGNSRTQLFFEPFPFYVARAEGCRLIDVDGHVYLDLVNNYTSLVHGHPGPRLIETLQQQVAAGTAYGAPSSLEVELADELCNRIPSIERVRFANSGTEAVLYACRAARLFTGKSDLVRAEGGYDGGHDGMQVGLKSFSSGQESIPERGVPQWVAEHTHLMPFNDIEASVALIRRVADRVAAVVVEPVQGYAGHLPAAPGYLQALRDVCDETGVLLIFDEVLTLRLASGGAQELFGVRPDLTALGKIIGGGLPVGAFGGRADVMNLFDPRRQDVPFHGGTFNANPMSLAGGLVYLHELTQATIDRMNDAGDGLRDHINGLAADSELPVVATGIGSLLRLHGGTAPPDSARDALSRDQRVPELLFYLLLEEGVFMGTKRGVMCISSAMDPDDLSAIASGFTTAMTNAAGLIGAGV